jgi:hypothetical protein
MGQNARVTPVPLARAELNFHGFPAEDRRSAAGQREIHLRKDERHRPLHASLPEPTRAMATCGRCWDLILYGIIVIQPTAPMSVFRRAQRPRRTATWSRRS